MNAASTPKPSLESYIEAARTVDEHELQAASRAFQSELPVVEKHSSVRAGWLRFAGVAAALVLAISLIPLVLPGNPGATAFAQAQAWFESYRTLHFVMTTQINDQPLTRVEVWTDDEGSTRVDVPPISHIVIPSQSIMHTVLPGGQVVTTDLPLSTRAFEVGDGMEWLDELRDFQGMAEIVGESRSIDGIEAMGWRVALPSGTHTLWVDPADNRPMMLDAELESGMTMESVFEFDQPLPDGLFDVPSLP